MACAVLGWLVLLFVQFPRSGKPILWHCLVIVTRITLNFTEAFVRMEIGKSMVATRDIRVHPVGASRV